MKVQRTSPKSLTDPSETESDNLSAKAASDSPIARKAPERFHAARPREAPVSIEPPQQHVPVPSLDLGSNVEINTNVRVGEQEVLPKKDRLAQFLRNLEKAKPASTMVGAKSLVRSTLNRVENAHSGVAFNTDNVGYDSAKWVDDGRMYPIPEKNWRETSNPDVARGRSKGHNTFVATNGAITIASVPEPGSSPRIFFQKNGADGRGIYLDGEVIALRRDASEPEIDDQMLAKTALLVASGVIDPSILRPEVLSKISPMLGKGESIDDVLSHFSSRLDEGSVRNAIGELAEAANRSARAVEAAPEVQSKGRDWYDWNRSWGFSLLSRENPRFRRGEYLIGWNQEAGQNVSHFGDKSSPSRSKARFESQLRSFAPQLGEIVYTNSGSDAVNLSFDIARRVGLIRNGIAEPKRKDAPALDLAVARMTGVLPTKLPETSEIRPGMAFFQGVYGAGRGEGASLNWRKYISNKSMIDASRFQIPSPTTKTLNPTDRLEVARLVALEEEALTKIRALAEDPEFPIGAIFIEPIQSSKGVLAYRPEFMRQLRGLADELRLPIIADEVFTVGRTGKFFAFEHYPQFEPDYVVFGKGLGVNGFATYNRQGVDEKNLPPKQQIGKFTTGEGSQGDFHKSAEILRAIEEDRLMERAEFIGARLQEALRDIQRDHGAEPEASAFGGLIGWVPPEGVASGPDSERVGSARRRMNPPLDLTDAQLEHAIRDIRGEM
jgi:4-aminobutyrate aminotransferase-like enzyme